MKFAIVFAAALAVVSAQYNPYKQYSTPLPTPYYQPTQAPYYQSTTYRPPVNRATNEAGANIINQSYDIFPDGSYKHEFQSDNGISAQAQGTPRDFGGNPPVVPVVTQGTFSWTSPEGVPVGITYTADENGYQPFGDAIPTPHPIPPAILKALEYIARNPLRPST